MNWSHLDERPFERTTHYRLMCVILTAWWIGYIHRANDARNIMTNLNEAAAATEEGSALNQLLGLVIAAVGVYHFPRAWRVLQSREARNLVIALLAYLIWSCSSLMWSEDPTLTIRRYGALLLTVMGCVGVGAGFYSRTTDGVLTLARHVVAAGVIASAMLLPALFAEMGVANILDPKFTVKLTMNIAALVFPVGYATLALIAITPGRVVVRWVGTSIGLAILVLLKGRTMLADVIAAGMILGSHTVSSLGLRRLLITLGFLLTAILADLGTGGRIFLSYVFIAYEKLGDALPWISNGAGLKNLTSLSGRVPLWNALYGYVEQRPIAGHGFGAFWNAEHLEQVYSMAGWRAVLAHNGFLDELLATGIIGLAIFSVFWIYGMMLGVRASSASETPAGYLVSGWMLLFLLFNTMDSVMQFYFQAPTLISLVGVFTLMREYSGEDPVWAGAPIGRPFVLRRVGV